MSSDDNSCSSSSSTSYKIGTTSRENTSDGITIKSYRVETASNISCISGISGFNRSYINGKQRREEATTDRSYNCSDISALHMAGIPYRKDLTMYSHSRSDSGDQRVSESESENT